MSFGEALGGDLEGEGEEDVGEDDRDSPVEHSFKNKDTMKTQVLPLAPILLVQNFVDAGEVGVERITAAIGTYKESLNWSWGCSGKTLPLAPILL